MTNLDSRLPKYLYIYRELASGITSGKYPPGSALPPQRELAHLFGVTLMTVRQAIRALEDDGLLSSRHGAGTFVSTTQFAYELGPLRSLADDMASAGARLRTTVLGVESAVPPDPVATRLGSGSAPVTAIERLRTVLGEREMPVLLQTSYLAPGIDVDPAALENRSLYTVLVTDHGIRLGRASETVRATLLDERAAGLLRQPAGAPALLSRRLTIDVDGRPVVDDRALLAGDVAVLRAERHATQLAMSYEIVDAG